MIIICLALEKEIPTHFKQFYQNSWVRLNALKAGELHRYKNNSFLVVVMGVGKPNDLNWLINKLSPSEIVNIGTAGSRSITVGKWCHLVSVSNGKNHIDLTTQTSLPIPYHNYEHANGRTVDELDLTIDADVIDMEAFYYAEICRQSGISFTSFKFITDRNDNMIKDTFNQQLENFHTQFNALLLDLILSDLSITVVIPVYNRSEYINKAVKSVLNQSYFPNEILVVDDGSDEPVSFNDNRIKVIRLENNSGVSCARNLGIQESNSNWITFLDSDDTWASNHLFEMVGYLKQFPLCRFLQTNETWIRNGKHLNKKAYHQKPFGWALTPSLERCLVSPSAVMLHRTLFDWHGNFDPKMTVCEDYDLWLRLLRFVPIGLVDCVTLIKYGGHNDQLSEAFPAMDRFRVQALIKLFNMERLESYKDQYRQQLIKKLTILKNGAAKRCQNLDESYYKSVLDQLHTNSPILKKRDVII